MLHKRALRAAKIDSRFGSKGFTITAAYDERSSNSKGNSLAFLVKGMLNALMRWRAKPGPTRIADVYRSFGTHPWVNYAKPNAAE